MKRNLELFHQLDYILGELKLVWIRNWRFYALLDRMQQDCTELEQEITKKTTLLDIATKIQEYFINEGLTHSDQHRKDAMKKEHRLTDEEYNEVLEIINFTH